MKKEAELEAQADALLAPYGFRTQSEEDRRFYRLHRSFEENESSALQEMPARFSYANVAELYLRALCVKGESKLILELLCDGYAPETLAARLAWPEDRWRGLWRRFRRRYRARSEGLWEVYFTLVRRGVVSSAKSKASISKPKTKAAGAGKGGVL